MTVMVIVVGSKRHKNNKVYEIEGGKYYGSICWKYLWR